MNEDKEAIEQKVKRTEDFLTKTEKSAQEVKEYKKEVQDESFKDTQDLIAKIKEIEIEYVQKESFFCPSVKTMIFMRAINALAHRHFQAHVESIEDKLNKELTKSIIEKAREVIEDEQQTDN